MYTEPTLPTTASEMLLPDFSDRANVLEGTDAKAMFGDGDTLSINRGTAHGVVLGARYAFYRDRSTARTACRSSISAMPWWWNSVS